MHPKETAMHLSPIIRAKTWRQHSAPIDCVIGMLLIAGSALFILPGIAAFAACALIAAVARSMAPARRPARIAR